MTNKAKDWLLLLASILVTAVFLAGIVLLAMFGSGDPCVCEKTECVLVPVVTGNGGISLSNDCTCVKEKCQAERPE